MASPPTVIILHTHHPNAPPSLSVITCRVRPVSRTGRLEAYEQHVYRLIRLLTILQDFGRLL